MKKLMLLAFTACLAFVAQAVTYSWTSTGSFSFDNAVTFKDGHTYTLTVDISKSETGDYINSIIGSFINTGNPRLFKINGAGNTNLIVDIVPSGAWWTGGGVNGGNWNNWTYLPTGDLTSMIFTITGTGTANGTLNNLTIAYNGATHTFDSSLSVGALSSIDILPVSSSALPLNTTLTVTETVPEPTALALLALGVAGLALKRKVA